MRCLVVLFSFFLSFAAYADEVAVYAALQKTVTSGNYQQASIYADQIRSSKPSIEARMLIVYMDQLLGNYEKAIAQLHDIEMDMTSPKPPVLVARIAHRMASILRREGRYKEALEYATRALEQLNKIGNHHDMLHIQFAGTLAVLHSYVGNFRDAEMYFNEAFESLNKHQNMPLQALILRNEKTIWLYQTGRFKDAVALESKAIHQAESLLPVSHPELGESYNNLAASLIAIGRIKDAGEWYRKAINLRQKALGKQHPDLATTMNNFALFLLERGDDKQAENLLRAALDIRVKRLGKSHPFTLSTMNNLSALLQKSGSLHEAKNLAETSLKRAIKQFGREHVEVAFSYATLGDMMLKIHEIKQAEKYYKLALNIQKKGHRAVEVAFLHQKLGHIDQLNGKMDAAATAYTQAIHELEPLLGEQNPKLAIIWNALGSVRYEQGKHGEAVLAMQRALAIQRPLLGDLHPATASSHNNIARVYTDLGKKKLALQHLELAANAFFYFARPDRQAVVYANLATLYADNQNNMRALKAFEKSIDALGSFFSQGEGLTEDERAGMIGQYAWIYQGMMQLLLKMHRSAPNAGYDKKLLRVVSRNQSRIFSELMLKTDAFGAMRNPKVREALAKESEAKNRWVKKRYALASLAQGSYSQQKRKALVKQVESAERQYKLSVQMIRASFPHLTKLRSPKAVTVAQVQHELRQGESVVVYALLEKEILLFVINRKEFHLFAVETGRKELTGLVHQLRRGVDGGYGLHGLKRLNPKLLHRAYKILLQPAEQMLNGTDLLYIVGDGALYTLPFEMLLKTFDASAIKYFKQQQSTAGDGVLFQEYAGLNYVSWPMIYMPSLSSFRVLKKKRKGHYDKDLIAFANPVFFTGTSRREREKYIQKRPLLRSLLRSPDGNSVALNSLPNTEDEVREVADALGGKHTLFFGKQARESVLYQTDLTENRYLIFATHGLLGSDFSLPGAEPSLALAMDNALHEGEDGLLSMSEVLNLKINSELVALSACNTSGETSRAQNGEGFAGLTRAFMYAGAHKLLVSHWSVETHSTQEFMRRFFASMSAGDTSYRALKQARKSLRSSYFDIEGRKVSGAHPFFWAPFVLVGVQ